MPDTSTEILQPYIDRTIEALRSVDPELTGRRIARLRPLKDLRLEAWEVSAYQWLYSHGAHHADDDPTAVWRLFAEAAALRIKIEEEATELSAIPSQTVLPPALRQNAEQSLVLARQLDQNFNDLMNDGAVAADSVDIDHLYRSRFRLLRSFSGLWLIYDQHVRNRAVPPRE